MGVYKRTKVHLPIIFVISWILINTLQVISMDGLPNNRCRSLTKCGLCLQVPECIWCGDPSFANTNRTYIRCDTPEGHTQQTGTCNEDTMIRQEGPNARGEMGVGDKTISPSQFSVKLYVGQRINISFKYTDPGNKPLDLYYLMDLSKTMEDDKPSVSRLAADFANALRTKTTDLRMGFGSFVDKPLMPYAAFSHLQIVETNTSRPPYGFHNHLPLTQVVPENNTFERTVNESKISVNLDAPEGGLDAMMQVMECWNEIGWREKAYKILVVSTDGTFHIAGDGKLGGLVIPNDEKCHLDKNGMYEGSTEYDYPSISQIISKVRDKQIYVFFAVQTEVENLYRRLSELMPQYATTIKIDSKSQEVSKLVQQQYNKISSSVEIISNSELKENEIKLKFFAKCEANEQYIAGGRCENLEPHAEVHFMVEIELRKCPENWNPSISITPTSSQEKVNINLNLRCGCDCEGRNDANIQSASACNDKGVLQCGICNCTEGYAGDYCQCQLDRGSGLSFGEKCSRSCGGASRGKCVCGRCQCFPGYSGDFCECEDKCSCSDSEYGRCTCGQCTCLKGYTGEKCQCSPEQDACYKHPNEEICSGAGTCECNQCKCRSDYVGKYCDICQSCKCVDEYVRCAIENYNRTHVQLKQNARCSNQQSFNITEFYTNSSEIRSHEKSNCKVSYGSGDCLVQYIYGYKESDKIIAIRVQKDLLCPPPLKRQDPLMIILITIGSVVVIGIFTLLLWKLITYYLDKHEFQKFEKECQNRRWGEHQNPLYQEASSTFQNPAYAD